jgi:hypothetical protein
MKAEFWNRLTEMARLAPAELPAEMPFGFDTRVLVDMRSQREAEQTLPWARLLRGALACSALVLLLSLAMNYQSLIERQPGSVAIADSVLRISLLP